MNQEPLISAFSLKAQGKPPWLIDQIIPRKTLAVLYGKPKTGKSFLALHWSCMLATSHTPVIYVAGEGLGGYGARLKAWEALHEKPVEPDTPLMFARQGLDLTLGDMVSKLIRGIKTEEIFEDMFIDDETEDLVEYVRSPGLIIIDTLSRSIPGGDENDAGVMSAAIGQLDRLRNETGAAILVVHHTTKDSADNDNARERGSSALRGAADVMIHMSTKNKTFGITAARDFESGASWNYTLAQRLESAAIVITEVKPVTPTESSEEKVLAAIESGISDAPALAEKCQVTREYVHTLLNKLIAKQLVSKSSRGIYVPAVKDLTG